MAKKKKKAKIELEENVSPNLIPMVDIMFLLLLFLMLGSDMGQRQFEEVFLPQVDASAVKEDKEGEGKNVTVINVYHQEPAGEAKCEFYEKGGICTTKSHWRIGVRGNDYTPQNIGTLLKEDAKDSVMVGTVSERRVAIRADQAAIYEYVQKVIEACAQAGIYKIELGAAAKA